MRKKAFFWSVLSLASLCWGATEILGLQNTSAASSAPYIDFANAGGVFTSRQAGFIVSDKTTTTSIGNKEESRNSGVRNSEVEISAQNTTKEKEEEIFSGSYNWTPDDPTLFHACGTDDWFDVRHSNNSSIQKLNEFYESYYDFMNRNNFKFSNFQLNGVHYAYPRIYVKFRGQVLDEKPMKLTNKGVIRVTEIIEMYTLFPDDCR